MPLRKGWLVACLGALALIAPASGPRADAFPALFSWQQTAAVSEREVDCLALNVYWEARSENRLGKLAVAAVTLNRVSAPAFPDSVCEVVDQGEERGRHRCQFSWRCDGLADTPDNVAAWLDARSVAQQALSQRGADPTDGALWYHADNVLPDWARGMRVKARIGHHLFYAARPRAEAVAAATPRTPGPQRPPRCDEPSACALGEPRFRLLHADPLPPALPRFALLLSAPGTTGQIRVTPFGTTARSYVALARHFGAAPTATRSDLALPPALPPPAPAR